jgi:putative ABC transport system substrate-binding protein
MHGIRRREFITLLGGAAAAWPLAARAQQQPVVGLLRGAGLSELNDAAFRQGLSQSGFVEGRNLAFEIRAAEGQYDRLAAMAADLARRRVALIVTNTPVAALAAKDATKTIPIVFALGSDPVRDGLVASLNRPGGNVTGATWFSNLLAAKRLEFLHLIVPPAALIAVLVNPGNANVELESGEAQAAARKLGREVLLLNASSEREIDVAFATLVQQKAAALFVTGDAYLGSRREQIGALSARHAIATSHSNRASVVAGGLMSYGADSAETSRQAGLYAGRILKGEKPADLPVQQATKFKFIINLKTAKALGLDIPATVLMRADEVIE